MNLHYRPDQRQGLNCILSPDNSCLKWISVYTLNLDADSDPVTWESGELEASIVIFGGKCTVKIDAGSRSATFPEIGEREDVFSGRPTMVYVPKGSLVTIWPEKLGVHAALVSAPAQRELDPVLVCPDECQIVEVGTDNWRRTVMTGIGSNVTADRLIIGETFNPPGCWSSSPPHKHDQDTEVESTMEEVYLYKLDPPQGFGLQRVYTAPSDSESFDVSYAVKNNDIVVLPRGYHPVVAAPGYRLYYLWILAGNSRRYGAWSDDPDHAWIRQQ